MNHAKRATDVTVSPFVPMTVEHACKWGDHIAVSESTRDLVLEVTYPHRGVWRAAEILARTGAA